MSLVEWWRKLYDILHSLGSTAENNNNCQLQKSVL